MEVIEQATPTVASPRVGDKVFYIPHEIHATHKDVNGNCAWVIGRRHPKTGEILELHGREVDLFLRDIRRHPNTQRAKKLLTLVRPAQKWPAVVRGINPDGTLNLDIQSNNGCVTLHYDKVKQVPATEPWTPHTCCSCE